MRHPGPADDFAAILQKSIDRLAGNIAAVDVELLHDGALREACDVGMKLRCSLLLGAVGGRHCAGEDEIGVEVGSDVALEAIEALALGLPTVAPIGVSDRDAPVGGNASANAGPAVGGIGLEMLLAQLSQRGEELDQGRLVQITAAKPRPIA